MEAEDSLSEELQDVGSEGGGHGGGRADELEGGAEAGSGFRGEERGAS